MNFITDLFTTKQFQEFEVEIDEISLIDLNNSKEVLFLGKVKRGVVSKGQYAYVIQDIENELSNLIKTKIKVKIIKLEKFSDGSVKQAIAGENISMVVNGDLADLNFKSVSKIINTDINKKL